jgi:hypothetical protein
MTRPKVDKRLCAFQGAGAKDHCPGPICAKKYGKLQNTIGEIERALCEAFLLRRTAGKLTTHVCFGGCLPQSRYSVHGPELASLDPLPTRRVQPDAQDGTRGGKQTGRFCRRVGCSGPFGLADDTSAADPTYAGWFTKKSSALKNRSFASLATARTLWSVKGK